MRLYDSHIHCCFSTDSDASPEAMISKAIELGLDGITFTDHIDPYFPLDPSQFIYDIDEYFNTLSSLKEKYSSMLDIRIGVEIGMREDQEKLLPEIASKYPFDFIIGSIHVVDGYDPYYPEYWNDKGCEEGLRRFFEATLNCVKMFDFYDALGHIDYIYRYAPKESINYPISHYMPIITEILSILIAKDKALEINTAGLKYGLSAPHPCSQILSLYRQLGGKKLTLGSDAHKEEHISYDFDKIQAYTIASGFDHYIRYENRKPVCIPFSSKQLAIFDMDGTILDTLEDLYTAVNYALNIHSLPPRSRAEVRSFLGNGIKMLITRSVPEGSTEKTIEAVLKTFLPYYNQHCAEKTKPYDGIIECIKKLRASGLKTAVVSNKADSAVQKLVTDYFNGLFDYSVGERQGINRKPSPDSVNEVLKMLDIRRDQAVYIGDSEVDLMTAKNSFMDCIAVSYGFREKEFLISSGAQMIADNTEMIKDYIEKL